MSQRDHRLSVLENYRRATSIGAYDRPPTGLFGKHDHVRMLWEDVCTRRYLREFLRDTTELKEPLCVADLGCGSGEGFRLLFHHTTDDEPVLAQQRLHRYIGFDISDAMIAKARALFHEEPRVGFYQVDLGEGLPDVEPELQFNIYFSSYAALSHLSDEELQELLGSLFRRMGAYAVFVADLLGRYSWEWTSYWSVDGMCFRDYSMSYLYPPNARDTAERFPMRYWGGSEFDQFVRRVAQEAGVRVVRAARHDRSVFVGRHTDTGAFNPDIVPIRAYVNQLFEPYHRTEVDKLYIPHLPESPDAAVNDFLHTFANDWNRLVECWLVATHEPLHAETWLYTNRTRLSPIARELAESLLDSLRAVSTLPVDSPIANFAEPLLGYLLRRLERRSQHGLGCGHGLLAYYEFARA